ncbi:MAG: DUF499 domain-containing protein, partial [Anaerolineae bacterium]
SRIPNLNRMLLDKKELFNQRYEGRMRAIIERELGSKFTAYLWPETPDGVPDNRRLKLIVLHPEADEGQIPGWIERKGTTFRQYQNTLIFALPDTGAFAKLKEDVKTVLALEEIEEEIRAGTSPLPEEKQTEVQRRKRKVTRDLSYNVRRMYHRLRTANREIDLGQPVTGNETLSGWYWRELTSTDYGIIVEQLHYRVLVNRLLSGQEQVPTAVILDQFYKNPDLPLPAAEGVVKRAIQLGVQEGALGLIERQDGELALHTLKFDTAIPLDTVDVSGEQLLLTRERSAELQAQLEAEREPEVSEEETVGVTATPGSGLTMEGDTADVELGEEESGPQPPPETVYHHLRLVIADVPAGKIGDVNRGIFLPLSNRVDGGLRFTLGLDITSAEGIPGRTLEQTIKETVRQIGARIEEEETN